MSVAAVEELEEFLLKGCGFLDLPIAIPNNQELLAYFEYNFKETKWPADFEELLTLYIMIHTRNIMKLSDVVGQDINLLLGQLHIKNCTNSLPVRTNVCVWISGQN